MLIRSLLAATLAVMLILPALAQERRDERWVASWAPALVARPVPGAGAAPGRAGAPPASAPAANPPAAATPPAAGAAPAAPAGAGRGGGRGAAPPLAINDVTIRQIARSTIAGTRVRVVLSNAFGTAPIRVGAAHVALRECAQEKAGCTRSSATAISGAAKLLTAAGSPAFTIAPGATLVTDPVDLAVPALADVVVDLYLPEDLAGNTLTWHAGSLQTSYVSAAGNVSGAAAVTPAASPASWFLISRLEVVPSGNPGVIALFGDSITDGAVSTVDTNSRWPDHLARRLNARRGGRPMAVLNLGISGNRLLADGTGPSALARFDRDVLLQTGVTHVVIMEGINDIGLARANPSPTAQDIINGYRQLIVRARARGLKVIGATLTPYEGAFYFTPEGEAKRQAVNAWIRTSREYDGVIDFDQITRDPANPTKFLPAYDSGDHLHPGDAGYKAMGEAVNLALFN
jgi:lysophospholipase L1-like esterase